MISAKQIGGLKKINITADPEKAKERVPAVYKSSSKVQKEELKKLTNGMTHNAYYNVAKGGAATAKVVLSLAQVMGVSPYYLIGETDEPELQSETEVAEFYKKYKDGKSKASKSKKAKTDKRQSKKSDSLQSKRKIKKTDSAETEKTVKLMKNAKATPPAVPATVPVNTEDYDIVINNSPKFDKLVKDLKEEDAIVLLKALVLKSKAGGNAEVLWSTVKRCLLS